MLNKKFNVNWTWALVNLGVVGLTGFALWYTHSLWSFLGLLFLFNFRTRPATTSTKCPKCEHGFVAMVKDDDDDEDET